MDETIEDPRIKEGICGATRIDGAGGEWVCISDPHKASNRSLQRGRVWLHQGTPLSSTKSDRHYMIKKKVSHDD